MRLQTIFLFILTMIVSASGCSAKAKNNKEQAAGIIAADTVMQKAVGDSVYNIIKKAKKVEITSLPLASDSLKREITKKVSTKELELMKFIATNPKNYWGNTAVYGEFLPQFQAKYVQKKATVILKYDFGLRKWGVFDAEGKKIAMFDLASDNMLRFACKMFPDNKFYHELLLTREE